jgi:type IV secretion system protein VirB8
MGARGVFPFLGVRARERAAPVAPVPAAGENGAPPTAVDDGKIEDWFHDRYQSARVNGNRWFVLAILFGALACLAVGTIAVLTPLKTVQPFLVEVNNGSGEVRVLKPFDVSELVAGDAVTKSLLAKYVIARETYDPQDLKENYQIVRLMSDPAEGLLVDSQLSQTNAASPLNRYQAHTVRTVRVRSVSFLNKRTAQVRFASTETTHTTKKEDSWVAIVSFHFVNLPETEEERFINPVGFQVTAYRIDQELGP